jgi:hydrogenase 3 maturation protease
MVKKKTSSFSWKTRLARILTPPAEPVEFRFAVLGIGNELNGDDSAGIHLARGLRAGLGDRPEFLVLEGGTIPENTTGPLRRFKPHRVLMVDAADLGLDPGAIQFVDLDDVRGYSASSHSLPLSVLGSYLKAELGCEVDLLCVQPQSLQFEAPMTATVTLAVDNIVAQIIRYTH